MVVILILIALILLAIPFVSSMLFKEKTSKSIFNITHARFSALGARNSAINLLLRTHSFYELNSSAQAPFDTPDYDTSDEFETNLNQLALDTSNPKGIIWSSKAEDEQGKINIRSAPRRVIEQLKSLLKPTDDIQQFLTEYSYRSTPWVAIQNLCGYVRIEAKDGNTYDIIYVDGYFPLGNEEGTRIRLQQGTSEFIAYVANEPCPDCKAITSHPDTINGVPDNHTDWVSNILDTNIWRQLGGTSTIELDRFLPDEFLSETTTVEIEQPHPVNINTASFEVLTALLTGVGSKLYNPDDTISDTTISEIAAKGLAQELKTNLFTVPLDLENVIATTPILSDEQRPKVWMNAFYPRDSSLANMVDRRFAGTLPFCYRSYDIYTINSSGIINQPSGNQAAVITLNEIVDIAPVGKTLTLTIESQYDFDSQFWSGLGNSTKMATYPTVTNLGYPSFSIALRKPDYSRASGRGALKLKTAEDINRGKNIILKDSFPETHEGVVCPLSYQRDDIFIFENGRDIRPGGVEFWLKFDSGAVGSATLFDINQSEYENRIGLLYGNNELVLSVCDAAVDGIAAQIRAPFIFEEEIWYHIGAFWKGTKYAQLALLVDGRPLGTFGHYNAAGQNLVTELISDVPADTSDDSQDQVVSVQSTEGFPPSGVLEIGNEVIEYESISGNDFVVTIWDRSVSPTQLTYNGRSARGTTMVSHPAGAKVSMFGYSTTFVGSFSIAGIDIGIDPLPIGGATLIDTIPATFPTTRVQTDGTPLPDDATIIPITSANNFPEKGYIRIDNEIIYYDEKIEAGTPDELRGCLRGQLETSAVPHLNNRPVNIYSIRVSDTTNYPSPYCLVQIDDEWLGPFQKVPDNNEYFVGIITGGIPIPIRGQSYNLPWARRAHNPDVLVIPVLAVNMPNFGAPGRGDWVTLIEQDQTTNPKEQKTIRNTYNIPGNLCLIAFTDNLFREYTVDNITRILKFPSDELPSYLPDTFSIGPNVSGLVDEVKFNRNAKGTYNIEQVLLTTDRGEIIDTISLNSQGSNSGIIKIGDEYIGYASVDGGTGYIQNCVRGYLNTPIQTQDDGQRAFNLGAFLPVTALGADISDIDYQIPLKSSTGFISNGGYVLIGNDINSAEVAGYCFRSGNNLRMPSHSDGIFRGMFGTNKNFFPANTLCYAILRKGYLTIGRVIARYKWAGKH